MRVSARFAVWLAFSLFAVAPASAQTVFFDDFDGDALLPHWVQPPPQDWEYNVSGGMLNVTRVLYPSSPQSPINSTQTYAAIPALDGFRLDASVGWESGTGPRWLGIEIISNTGSYVASPDYSRLNGDQRPACA